MSSLYGRVRYSRIRSGRFVSTRKVAGESAMYAKMMSSHSSDTHAPAMSVMSHGKMVLPLRLGFSHVRSSFVFR